MTTQSNSTKPTPTVSTAVDADAGTLVITVIGHPAITVRLDDLDEDLARQAALHGLKQKYVDKAALGAQATPAERYAAIRRMVDHHAEGGDWNMVATGGDGASGDGLLVRAIAEATGIDRDAAREAVGKMDKKTQAAMRASAELEPIIRRLREEKPAKVAKGVDVGGVLAGLRARTA